MSPNISLDAMFLVFFDDHRGQSLIWHRSKLAPDALDGIEFQALPSGLHLVPSDAIYFTHSHQPPSTSASSSSATTIKDTIDNKKEDRLCIAVFENKELSEVEVEAAGKGNGGRGRRMMSLGVVMSHRPNYPPSFPPLSQLRSLLSTIQSQWTGTISPLSDSDKLLDEFWEEKKGWKGEEEESDSDQEQDEEGGEEIQESEREGFESVDEERELEIIGRGLGLHRGVTVDHPIRALVGMVNLFGPGFCTLWKYALSGRRIMFYSQPPLLPVCQIAYSTWTLSKTSLLSSNRSLSTRKGKGKEEINQRSTFLGCVGLMDMVDLEGRGEGGWVACTSDAIFKDRHHLYDLLVDLSDCNLSDFTNNNRLSEASAKTPIMTATVQPTPNTNTNNQIRLPIKPSELTTRTVTYSFSDMSPWKECQSIVRGGGSYPPNINDIISSSPSSTNTSSISRVGAWLVAYSAYAVICDVCWGICSLAMGGYGSSKGDREAHARKHAHGHLHGRSGGIRLEDEDEDERDETDAEPLLEADIEERVLQRERDESDELVDKGLSILRLLSLRAREVITKIKNVSSSTTQSHPSLKSEDMTSIGLSAWSWTDVEFVRSLYKLQVKEEMAMANGEIREEDSMVIQRGWAGWISGMFWL